MAIPASAAWADGMAASITSTASAAAVCLAVVIASAVVDSVVVIALVAVGSAASAVEGSVGSRTDKLDEEKISPRRRRREKKTHQEGPSAAKAVTKKEKADLTTKDTKFTKKKS